MKYAALFLLPLLCMGTAWSQRAEGPVIPGYGAVFPVDDPDFPTDPEREYKVVFDIHDRPGDPGAVNPMLATLARFLNMHVQAGVPLENLKAVGVIHNRATPMVWDSTAYREKFGVDNPNLPLMEALEEAGAKIYLCGQSMHARGIEREHMAEPVQVALSAMTVFLSLRDKGYLLIRF